MARAGSISTRRVAELLTGPAGLADSLAALSKVDDVSVAPIEAGQISELNVPPDLAEKLIGFRYPAVGIYCDKVTNTQHEKFRTFSGTARVVIEVRVTHDQLNDAGADLHMYVEAITRVLDANRGDWGAGLFYAGGYEIVYAAVKSGGRNYIQTAKVTLTIDINT